jgi:hypothetical protein
MVNLDMGEAMPAINQGAVSIKLTRNGNVTRIPVQVDSQVSVETRPLDLGDSRRDKYIDLIVLELEHAEDILQGKLYVKELARLKDEDKVSYSAPIEVTDFDAPIHVRLQSRFVQLKLVDEFPQVRWKLTAIDFYGQPMMGRM